MASLESRSSVLSPIIDRDPLAADFLVSIFWSAMMSFRHDTVLRPFPPAFIDEQDPINTGSHKNILKLVRIPFIARQSQSPKYAGGGVVSRASPSYSKREKGSGK